MQLRTGMACACRPAGLKQWGKRDLTLNNPVALGSSQTWRVGESRLLTANAPVSGGFELTKGGEGTPSLTTANTYTGGTTINNGTLRLDGGSVAGNIVNHSLLVWNLTASQTFGGTISGTGSVTKDGAGTLVLASNANSFTGNTTIQGGVLELSVSVKMYNGAYNNSDITVNGTINNELALHPGAHFSIQLPGTPLTVSGNLNLAGTVDIADAGGFGPGTYLRLSLARDANATGVVIEGLRAGNLVDWSTSTTVIESNTPALFRVRDSVPIGAEPQRFMRLRFSLP